MTKKSIFWGPGGSAENSSKTWSKVTFLLLHRRKSGQKVGKNCHFAGGRVGPSKWPPEAVFHNFVVVFWKTFASSNLNRSCHTRKRLSFYDLGVDNEVGHCACRFHFQIRRRGFKNTRGSCGYANDGTQDRFHVWGQHGFHSWSSTRIAINIWLRFLAIVGFFFSSISLQEDNEFSGSYD